MAYYEMMPAGLPAGLQSGMDSVLNKKFGTATSYAPGTWPDTVNIMGPLPEKTIVSSPVADFSDGADDVPTKSLVVTISPTLSGVSLLNETQTWRNLFNLDRTEGIPDPTDIIISPRILDVTKLFKGLRADNYFYAGYASYSISGGVLSVTTSNNLNYGIAFPVRVKGGATYCLSAILTGANMSVGCYDKNWNFISRIFDMVSDASRSFSTPSNAEYITVVFGSSTLNVAGTVSNIQLEVGNTATTFEPYTTPTTYTASLGRTIYGGTADIVNGKCEPTNWIDNTLLNLEQGSISGSTGNNENANNRVRNVSAIPFPYDEIVSSYTWTIPSGYKVAIRPYDANGNFVQLPSWALAFITQLPQNLIGQGITQMRFVLAKTDNSVITPSDMAEVGYILNKGNTAAAYSPYFEPFTFTGQEINTRLGYNAFWSDEGDTEVTYRADINLALQALSGSRGLMMARPQLEPETEPEETKEETPEEMEK